MRWLDDVSMDLRKMGVNEWRGRSRNREAKRHIVEKAKAHPGLYRRLEEDLMDAIQLCFNIEVYVFTSITQ